MIYFEKYDINTTAKVIKIVWDALNGRYDSIEVGEARASLSQAIDTVVDGRVDKIEKLTMQTLRTADGKNTIYFGLDEPLATQYPLKKNDIWYRIVDGEFTRTYIYDGVVWQLVIDMDSAEANAEAQQAKDRADDAVNRANQATGDAQNAIEQAQTSFNNAQENALVLETLGLRFNDVEGNLTTISGTVDGLQTTVSDVQGNVSNLTQLSTTLQTRLSDAEGNINTLTLTSQSMQSTISSLQDDWDNLEIGGRNLLRNSKGPFEIKPRNEGVSGDNYQYQRFYCDMEAGKEYTISAKIEVTHGDYDEVTIYVYPSGTRRNVPIEGDGTVKSTFIKTNENSDSVLIYAGIAGATRNQGAIISNVQIEKGNKATDWTPAPEDIDTKITSINTRVSELRIDLDSITTTVQNTQSTVDDLTGVVNHHTTQIS